MKKMMFIFTMLVFLPLTSHAENILNETGAFTIAKAVKLGRGSSVSAYSSGKFGNSGSGTKLAKSCVRNCASCNQETQECSVCRSGYYLTNGTCSSCPANATCLNGIAFICNDEYYQSSNQCVSICTGVRCVSGTTATPTNNRCCCF